MDFQVLHAFANSVSESYDFLLHYSLCIMALATKQSCQFTSKLHPTILQVLHTLFRHHEMTIYHQKHNIIKTTTTTTITIEVSVITQLNLGYTDDGRFVIWEGQDFVHEFNNTNAFCMYLLKNVDQLHLTI